MSGNSNVGSLVNCSGTFCTPGKTNTQILSVHDQQKLKITNELHVIYREYSKVESILNDKKASRMKKSQVDPEKWRKKFWFMMDREKIFCFDQQEGSQQFSKKGIITSLEPKLVKKALGEEILKESAHFWILFI